jgi:PPOX class probable F420-dependent enzyme
VDDETLGFIDSCRRAVLATIAPDGRPRLVPICFALDGGAAPGRPPLIYSPLDEKPKRSGDVRRLARVRDITERPAVTLLFDRWSEDWSELAWVRIDGEATVLEPAGDAAGEHRAAVILLRARYPQYEQQRIDRLPLIRIVPRDHRRWGATVATSGGSGPPDGREA